MDPKNHWEKVYQTKEPDQVSWYRPHLDVSLELITKTVRDHDARIIDVGGGEATLVDDLLASGYKHIDVFDLSQTALDVARNRLGNVPSVRWLRGDVTTYSFDANVYDVWHDRAVFHFLTHADQRQAYVRQVLHAVKPGGHVIVASFWTGRPHTMQRSGCRPLRRRRSARSVRRALHARRPSSRRAHDAGRPPSAVRVLLVPDVSGRSSY